MTWKIYEKPESTGSIPEEKTGDAGVETGEKSPSSADPAQLQGALESARAEAEQWRDRFLRKAAEFDNYRKRTDKERADTAILAKSSILLEFLPTLDACERAMETFNTQAAPEAVRQYREGVELLYKQVHDVLQRAGVNPIAAQGQKFDPHFHEALMREESSEYEENTVIRELRRGYMFRDRLLRPAQVVVSTRPQIEASA